MKASWDEPARVLANLGNWAAETFERARVERLERLPGHSASTWAVDVTSARGRLELVVKLAPPGVPRREADILRQGALLRALHATGLRVPAVISVGGADGPLGCAHLVMSRVPGRMPGNVFITGLGMDKRTAEGLFAQAIDELAQIHAVAADQLQVPRRTAKEEIEHWRPLFARSDQAAWTRGGERLHDALLASVPDRDPPTGLVHGDFYSNNWLFSDADELTAVVDWETSTIGPQTLDVGWLCLFYDRDAWGPARRALMTGSPESGWLLERYEAAEGRPVADLGWYAALAAYRLAALTTYYVRLHRTGRRVDPAWNVLGEAVPFLRARAESLLSGRSY